MIWPLTILKVTRLKGHLPSLEPLVNVNVNAIRLDDIDHNNVVFNKIMIWPLTILKVTRPKGHLPSLEPPVNINVNVISLDDIDHHTLITTASSCIKIGGIAQTNTVAIIVI